MNNDKLDLKSPDLANENIEKLAALFPNCVTENANGKAIDFDLLKQELSHNVVEGTKERYRLEWPGKREAIVTANLPTTKTLRPVREDSVNFDDTKNLYIEGDNLEVLKLLQESYLDKVKMIYIDPPYNTGNDSVYRDNFNSDKETELFKGGQKDEYNQRLIANPETAGSYHSNWLNMMYPRLKLARNLLSNDGIIFISIDDNEVANLKKISNEIYGANNFYCTFVWQRRSGAMDSVDGTSTDHEYILCFAKNKNRLKGKKRLFEKYTNPDKDPRGPWVSDNLSAGKPGGDVYYNIEDPKTGNKFAPPEGRYWPYNPATMKKKIAEGRIIFPKTENGRPMIKRFQNEAKSLFVPVSSLMKNINEKNSPTNALKYTFNTAGTKEVQTLFDKKIFSFPKPTLLIKELISQINDDNENFIALDFFSGSSSSAHAILSSNAKNNFKIKFIQVQLPEKTNEKSEAYKAGYKNICEIGKERIRRAGKQIVNDQLSKLNDKKDKLEKTVNGKLLKENGKWKFSQGLLVDEKAKSMLLEINKIQSNIDNLDTGFRVYRLDSSNMKDVYYRPQDYKQEQLDLFADNVKPDRTENDLLAQVMIDWGLPLSLKIEQINISGKKVFKVEEDSLYACFDNEIDESFAKEIAKKHPLRIVFRDNSFKDDNQKVNVQQLLKQLSPETEIKVI